MLGEIVMLYGAILVLLVGFFAGHVVGKLAIPRLLGMLLAGILLGPHGFGWIEGELLALSSDIRVLALVVILLRAGLGLDKDKIKAQGSTALLLGILPCTLEAAVLAVTTHSLLGWSWVHAWLLGWVICAESPAVLVPLMLRLKAEGWGAKSGLPDLVLAGGALSDVVAITVFGIVLDMAGGGRALGAMAFATILMQVVGGLVAGFVVGRFLAMLLYDTNLAKNPTQETLLALTIATLLALCGGKWGYSGYLAVMTAGFAIVNTNEILARRIRGELNRVWVVAEIFLFVLIGAEVNLPMIQDAGGIGVLLLAMGLLFGRIPGILLATAKSSLSSKEKVFMSVGYLAKATVQAAIGAVPLAMGIPNGELILAFAVLAIAITAPIGALGTSFLAPRLLDKGPVDPTKVTVEERFRFLIALDSKGSALAALEEAARFARQTDAKMLVVHIDQNGQTSHLATSIYDGSRYLFSDIEHDFVVGSGEPSEAIIELATMHDVDLIFMGNSDSSSPTSASTTTEVLKRSVVPVMVV